MSWVMERNRCGGRDAALVPKVMSGPKLRDVQCRYPQTGMPCIGSAPLADEESRHFVVKETDTYHEKMTHS